MRQATQLINPCRPAATALLLALLAALTLGIFLLRNLPWHLDDHDQAKQAFTSYEMIAQGHWGYQHTPSGRIATKPPLAGWVSAALFTVTQSWDLSWRLPNLLAALAIAGCLAAAFRANLLQAVVVSASFCYNLLTPRLSTLVRTDMLLALWVFLAGWLLLRKVQRDEPWHWRERLVLMLLLTAALMTKGPIAFAFLAPGVLALFLASPGAPTTVGAKAHASAFLSASVPALAVFLGWVAYGVVQEPGFYDQVVLHEFLGRFTTGQQAVHRPQPIYFYVPHLVHKAAPWSLLLGFLLLRREQRRALRMDPALLVVLGWALGGLLVMSLVPSKRVDRLFPVVPALSLALGLCLQRFPAAVRPRHLCFVLTLAAVVTTGEAAHSFLEATRARADALARFGQEVRALAHRHQIAFEALAGRDEGLLLYVGKLRHVDAEEAKRAWERGAGLVLNDRQLLALGGALGPFQTLARIARPGGGEGYVFIKRP